MKILCMLFAVATLLVFAGTSQAQQLRESSEMDMAIQLKGIAAMCALDHMKRYLEAPPLAQRTAKQIAELHDADRRCVDDARFKGRKEYRRALAAAPTSSAMLSEVYARWLGYVDTIVGSDERAKERAEDRLKTAINNMQSRVDARNTATH